MLTGNVKQNEYVASNNAGFANQFSDFIDNSLGFFSSTIDNTTGFFNDTKNKLNDVSKTLEENEFFKKAEPETSGGQPAFLIQAQKNNDNKLLMIMLAFIAFILVLSAFKK